MLDDETLKRIEQYQTTDSKAWFYIRQLLEEIRHLRGPGKEDIDCLELPQRQKEALLAILYLKHSNNVPTHERVMRLMGLRCKASVHQHCIALRHKGLLTWDPTKNGTLQINFEQVKKWPRLPKTVPGAQSQE